MASKIFTDDQLRRRDIDTLKRFLRQRLGGYGVAIKDIRPGNRLYRGVRCETRPERLERISYPPPERVTQLGRVNRPGQSVFYCSVGAPAVFFELRAKPGDLVALSEWELVEPLWMHNIGYHQYSLQRMQAPAHVMRPQLTDPIPNETPANAKLRRALSSAFTEDVREGREYRYKQSIAINELLFDRASPLPLHPDGPRFGRAAGIVYPALQMRGAADNVAMSTEFVHSSLRIRSVRYVRVESADEESSSYAFLTVAISHSFSSGDIIWQATLLPESQRRSRIALEGGTWVLRDGFNRIYDLH